MRVRSVNVGMPQTVMHEGREVQTGIFKQPVDGAVRLTQLLPEGDGQADMVHHGGPHKAVCAYPFERYAYWEEKFGRPLPAAAFGENLTLEGLTEETVCIGDTYQVGTVVLQVAQPRIPCFKLSLRNQEPTFTQQVVAAGYTGFYFRVLQEGAVKAGDSVTLLERPAGAPTVMWANRILHHERENLDGARELLAAEGLAPVWQAILKKRLGAA